MFRAASRCGAPFWHTYVCMYTQSLYSLCELSTLMFEQTSSIGMNDSYVRSCADQDSNVLLL